MTDKEYEIHEAIYDVLHQLDALQRDNLMFEISTLKDLHDFLGDSSKTWEDYLNA